MTEKKQRTSKGYEIPVTKRSDFMRDLQKVAQAKKSPTRSPKK